MEPNSKLPGLTFYVTASELRNKQGVVRLDATVEDVDLWDTVLQKLNGFRVYTVTDLHTALHEVMSEDIKNQKELHAREVAALRSELEHYKQHASMLEQREKAYHQFERDLAVVATGLPLPSIKV